MTDYILPHDLRGARVEWSGENASAAYTPDTLNAIRTSEIAGSDALRMNVTWPTVRNSVENLLRRNRAVAALRKLRGQANRIWLPVFGYRQQGSFSAPEIAPNPYFQNNAASHLSVNANFSATVADHVLRILRLANSGGGFNFLFRLQTAAVVTANLPHVARLLVMPGRGPTDGLHLDVGSTSFGNEYAAGAVSTAGMLTTGFTPLASPAHVGLLQDQANNIAGDFLECAYFSVSRCLEADNGANYLAQSEAYQQTAAWTVTRTTVSANAVTAPNGATTGDRLVEDSSASTSHYVAQNVTGEAVKKDWQLTVLAQADTRTFIRIVMRDTTTSEECYVDVNLTTGALGTPAVSGASWISPRAWSRDFGNGWYAATIVGRHDNTNTGLQARIMLASALGTVSYSGNGASRVALWRAVMSPSSVPVRIYGAGTTSAANPTGTPQTGTDFYVKGGDPSINDALRIGDWIQVGREHHSLRGSFNTDAAGCGCLELCEAPRQVFALNEPVIIQNPLGKYLRSEPSSSWTDSPAQMTDVVAEFIAATAG